MNPIDELILVSPATKAGESFIHALKVRGMPFATLTNNENGKKRLVKLGVEHVLRVDTRGNKPNVVPELPIGKVYLFEDSLTLCCRYIQICRQWTGKPIFVITRGDNSKQIYKGLGADYVIHSNGSDLSFLINGHKLHR
ncbi:hypothetical protein [Cohnella lupini]|uniref:Response regulatory domain-containing protein n=1 Tax=Cohnella lupini TaxID=1294267 RepID=A0A3D9HTX7_9BACL|nr:hypothetical protein [Cohnella lupini]RED52964.1 hypothetical protein DFP95_12820 [Cohnella lupini]